MRRGFVILAAMSLVVAACGGDSSGESDSTSSTEAEIDADTETPAATNTTTTTQPAADDDGDQPTATQPAGDSGGEGPSTATVTIGDVTYQASSEGALGAQCLPDLFGIVSVNLPLAGGGDGRIEIIALHEGTDPVEVEVDNRVHVTVGDGDWIADPLEIRFGPDEAALSQVESVEVVGSTVAGTATFVGRDNTTQEWVSMSGTFEATCGEERLS